MEGSQMYPLRANVFFIISWNCLFSLWKEDASVSASRFEGLYPGGKNSSCENPRIVALIKRPLSLGIPMPGKSTSALCSLLTITSASVRNKRPSRFPRGLLISENQTQVTSFNGNVPAAYSFAFRGFQPHRWIFSGEIIMTEGTITLGNSDPIKMIPWDS